MNVVFKTERLDVQADYICRRVVNALLRENVRDCVSRAQVLEGHELAFGQRLPVALSDGPWLCLAYLGQLYIPVERCDFMQAWRLRDLPLVQLHNGRVNYLDDINAILDCFQQGLSESLREEFVSFVSECQTAITHSVACAQAREQLFRQHRTMAGGEVLGEDNRDWAKRLLHYERLASFLDHPFYPTARAKLGFSTADLSAYAPEFGATFKLCWLAVPRTLYRENSTALPTWWPRFNDVNLPLSLADSHCLLPVHPFMWQHHLQALLQGAGLDEQVVRAPTPFLDVTATLSVRTVVVQQAPQWHLKLPLSIRTLGAKNIRTIKPSTIKDGHTMQGILRAIAINEPDINGALLLTDESRGAEVADKNFLGFILRTYPAAVEDATVVPVAALVAETPSGITVFEDLAQQFYESKVDAFFEAYVALTLRLHLTLWVRYGVALESNQQNSMLVLSHQQPHLRLLLKDNDAGRLLAEQLVERCPELSGRIETLQDRRILVDGPLSLAKMFTTITFQLNIAVLVEGLVNQVGCDRNALYDFVRSQIQTLLTEFELQGEEVSLARHVLLEDEQHYLKYLLRASSLENRESTGAADVNKFYGKTAPNILLARSLAK